MNFFKKFGKFLWILTLILVFLLTIFFLFSYHNYGINILSDVFKDGFFNGIKNFFIDLWKGILFTFGK